MNQSDQKSIQARVDRALRKPATPVDQNAQPLSQVPSVQAWLLFFGVVVVLISGMLAYAWGDTQIRADYVGIAYRQSRKMCGAYKLTRWMAPAQQRLPKPDQWQLLAAEVKDGQIPSLSTSQGSCRADQTEKCCALFGLEVTGLPPRDLWNKPSWELPTQYR